jgi:hypothetical protein
VLKPQTICDVGKKIQNRQALFTNACLLVTAAFILFMAGCATTKSFFERFRTGGDALTKKVMALPLADVGGLGQRWTAQAQQEFFDLLGRSPRISLHFQRPGENPGATGVTPVEYGIITNPEMIRKAKAQGMNVVVTGALNPVEMTRKKAGIWPFRKKVAAYKVSMVVNVVDVNRGYLDLTSSQSEEVTFPLEEDGFQDEAREREDALESVLPKVVKRQADAVLKELKEKPWTGKILSAGEGGITISGGKEAGIVPGSVFTVYPDTEPIATKEGRTVYPLGKPVGTIRVKEVMTDSSRAVGSEGGPFVEGQLVRPGR